jgi:hypothetical protein
MKATLFYLLTFVLVIYSLSQFFGWSGVEFLQRKKQLNAINQHHLQKTLQGKWQVKALITNEEQEIELNGDVLHEQSGDFILYFKLRGTNPNFFAIGNKLTGGGSIKGRWHVSDSLTLWQYTITECTFDISYHTYPFDYFDLCNWLKQDVGLSFGNYTTGLSKQSFIHFSNHRIAIEEERYSEKGERAFYFSKIDD